MLDLGPHAAFIWASYAATALVVGGLTAWIIVSDRQLRRDLAALEAGGARRRSARSNRTIQAKAGTP